MKMKTSNRPRHALEARLRFGVTVLAVVGLGAVQGLTYLLTTNALSQRQAEHLAEKVAVISRVMQIEPRPRSDKEWQQQLDSFMPAREDVRVRIYGPDRTLIFADERSGFPREHQIEGVIQTPDNFSANIGLSIAADEEFLKHLAFALLSSLITGAAVMSALSTVLVRRALQPVRRLADQTDLITVRNLAARLSPDGQPEELLPLINHFNALVARLQQSYQRAEAFNANVAHEINTPLATLSAGLELAIRGAPRSDAAEQLASFLEEVRRVSSIVEDMLFLSRADRGAKAQRAESVQIATVAQDVLDYHEAQLEQYELTARINGCARAVVDTRLLKRALSNLIGNACRYASRGSTVEIRIEEHQLNDAAGVRLSVVNQGDPIHPNDLPHLFERFFRADAARSGSGAHHGLGLAIVAAVAAMHDGEVFSTSDANGTQIGMWLPMSLA